MWYSDRVCSATSRFCDATSFTCGMFGVASLGANSSSNEGNDVGSFIDFKISSGLSLSCPNNLGSLAQDGFYRQAMQFRWGLQDGIQVQHYLR
jgi:hypothetical protein